MHSTLVSAALLLAMAAAGTASANAISLPPSSAAQSALVTVGIGDKVWSNQLLTWEAVEGTDRFRLAGGPLTWTDPTSGSSLTIGGGTWFDPDPVLAFSASATNNTGAAMLYSFSFNAPLLPNLVGPVTSHAELRVALTDGDHSGNSTTFVLPPSDFMLKSYDFSTAGVIPKNVDVGPAFYYDGMGLALYEATSSLVCGQPCTTMSTQLSFFLSAHDTVGFSGLVEQTQVPLPGAIYLLGSGLAGLWGVAGRRRRSLQTSAA
jgi:hypothetical protein